MRELTSDEVSRLGGSDGAHGYDEPPGLVDETVELVERVFEDIVEYIRDVLGSPLEGPVDPSDCPPGTSFWWIRRRDRVHTARPARGGSIILIFAVAHPTVRHTFAHRYAPHCRGHGPKAELTEI